MVNSTYTTVDWSEGKWPREPLQRQFHSRCISNLQQQQLQLQPLQPPPPLLLPPMVAVDPEPQSRHTRSLMASPRRTVNHRPLPHLAPKSLRWSRLPRAADRLGTRAVEGMKTRTDENSGYGDHDDDTSTSASSSWSLPLAFRNTDSEITFGHVMDHFRLQISSLVLRGRHLGAKVTNNW